MITRTILHFENAEDQILFPIVFRAQCGKCQLYVYDFQSNKVDESVN